MVKVVMVVDDSATIRQEVAAVLGPEGFKIVEAADGEEALGKLDSEVALVLCDVNMPRMNGLDFLDQLKARKISVPVLMLTTEGQPDSIERAKLAGAKGWIIKPFKAPQLIAAVKQVAR
ncbi:MAG TPA: response regulator [Polyangiaceae bacterium]|jgi:two-component system chemotaxis response regulator CheY